MRSGNGVQRTSVFQGSSQFSVRSHKLRLRTYFQSYVPSRNQFPLSLSCTKRYNTSPVSAGTAMSHSSRDQPSCSDQSPEERQGPAVQTISPAMSSRSRHRMRTGFASRKVMLAPSGGRNRRKAITALILSFAVSSAVSSSFFSSSHAL